MLLPLEEWLQEKATVGPNLFPDRDRNYFNLYAAQKDKFERHIYPYVDSGMIEVSNTSNGGKIVYTDHGINHVNAVIGTAGRLLGCTGKDSELSLAPYEVYLLLMAILSHDAGNIDGREDHQLKVFKLLNGHLTKVLEENSEMREIHNIAKSHTGKGFVSGRESKDTIVSLKRETSHISTVYHPRRIAALLRFSDEICEDRRRVPIAKLDDPTVSGGPSAPYLFYGQSITSVDILKNKQSIRIQFDLSPEQVLNPIEFISEEGQPKADFLIDIVLKRLEKIRRERAYCFRFLHGVIEFVSVTAEINVVKEMEDGNFDELSIGVVDISEADYPSERDNSFLKEYSAFSGEVIKKRLAGML